MKPQALEEYVQIDHGAWAPFPEALSTGGITWKLLHVSPEAGTWTAVFDCPAGSSFNAHIHTGPGEYLLYKGRMDVRGGAANGGDTAIAPGYGFESSGARHDNTHFPVDSALLHELLWAVGLHPARWIGHRARRMGRSTGRVAGPRRGRQGGRLTLRGLNARRS